MQLRNEPIFRQMTLVSYGTKFLREEITLEEWYRHRVFFDTRLQFRRFADNVLLADDFTLWLTILKKSGVVRLTLHLAAEFDTHVPRIARGGDYVVIAHHVDHYGVWVVGEERAGWQEHPLLSIEVGKKLPLFPSSTSYSGNLDSYWRIDVRQGKLAVPNTDWQELVIMIANDLAMEIPVPSADTAPFLFSLSEELSWANFPIFPMSRFSASAHSLLTALYDRKEKINNDRNPKNENSDYYGMDEKAAAEADSFLDRLNSWLIEVELRCANEYRRSDLIDRNTPFRRIVLAPFDQRNAVAPFEINTSISEESLFANISNEKFSPKTTQPWIDGVANVLVVGILSVFMLGIAKIVAIIPWLSIFFGLIWALYVRDKKK